MLRAVMAAKVNETYKHISSVLPCHSHTSCLIAVFPFQTCSSVPETATSMWLGLASKAGRVSKTRQVAHMRGLPRDSC